MSVRGGFYVVCDDRDCDEQVIGGLRTATEAARVARSLGWAVSPDTARCPKHRQRPLVTHEYIGLSGGSCRAGNCWMARDHAVHWTRNERTENAEPA